jgi:putative hemolysin
MWHTGEAMLLELLVILVLVLVNGLFAGAEIAVVAFERSRLTPLVEAGSRRALAVQALRASPDRFFATVQIVITVVSATAGAFGGATFARDLTPWISPWFGEVAGEVAIAGVVLVISSLSLVLGELVPKSLALRHREPYALFVAPGLLALSRAAQPLVWTLTKVSNLLLRFFDDETTIRALQSLGCRPSRSARWWKKPHVLGPSIPGSASSRRERSTLPS